MLPTVNLGPLVIPTAGLVYILGIWTALSAVERAAARLGQPVAATYNLAVTGLAAGFVGARLTFVALHWQAYAQQPLGIIWPLTSGFSPEAGLLIGVAAAFFYGRAQRLPLAATLDALAPGLLVALLAVSLADFLAGPGYGIADDLPWSINVPHEFDPGASAGLLETAGLTDADGDGIREFDGANTDFEILCDVNSPTEVRAAELIAQWLGDVGIGASPRCQDIDTSVAQIWPNFVSVPDPDYDMAIWGWSAVPQFRHGFIRGLFNCDFGGIGWGNLSGMCDPEFDAILDEFVSLSDLSRVDELSADFQERFVEIIPWVPLASPNGNFAYVAAEYDGWVYLNGSGIMTVWSFLPAGSWE